MGRPAVIVRNGRTIIDYGPTPAPHTAGLGGEIVRAPSAATLNTLAQHRYRERTRQPSGPRVVSEETRAKMSAAAIRREALRAAEKAAA